jgi:hypothetical protein
MPGLYECKRHTVGGICHHTTSRPPSAPHRAPVRERWPSVRRTAPRRFGGSTDHRCKHGFGGQQQFRRATLVVCRGLSLAVSL